MQQGRDASKRKVGFDDVPRSQGGCLRPGPIGKATDNSVKYIGGDDHDILLGDHGLLDYSLDPNQNFVSIFTSAADGGGNDVIHGNAGDDFILGQQGKDRLFGDAGDDDLTGGHNVTFGADARDLMFGGSGADVMLGDNGMITRSLLPGRDDAWVKYPAPYPDVIRQVQRFDDLDKVAGDDIMRGNAGQDIIHGQRGNDRLFGGADDDELFGELGNDRIAGDAGNDVLIADVGYVERSQNADGTPRLNENGSHHRDVFLEDVGSLVDVIDLNKTPLVNPSPKLAEKILRADVAVLAGDYATQTGAGKTKLLLIDLAPANNDRLRGGAGDDVMFGQRGDDKLWGNAGSDVIFADNATNTAPILTDLPHIFNGLRVISIDGGILNAPILNQFGTAFFVPATIYPEVLQLNQPFAVDLALANVLPDVTHNMLQAANAGPIWRADGSILRPFVAIVPDVVQHKDVLPGNDFLNGGAGNDLLVGDNAIYYSPMLTGLDVIDSVATDAREAINLAMHTLRGLANDFDHAEHDLRRRKHPHLIETGNDTIVGGGGADVIFGDLALVGTSFTTRLPVSQKGFAKAHLELLDYLAGLRRAALDLDFVLFEAHYKVLNQLIAGNVDNGLDHDHHDLQVGNDEIQGGGQNDLMIGDSGLLLTPVVSGIRFDQIQAKSPISQSIWEATRKVLALRQALKQRQLIAHLERDHNRRSRTISAAALNQLPGDDAYELTIGNDEIHGNAGADVVVGDFGVVVMPIVLREPDSREAADQLNNDIEDLLHDVEEFVVQGHHEYDYDDLHARYLHPHYAHRVGEKQQVSITAGNDTLYGDAGNDFVLGDSVSLYVTYQAQKPTVRMILPDPRFELKYLYREDFELKYYYERAGVSQISNDWIYGGRGNDSLYGQHRDDHVFGEDGDDLVYGGDGPSDEVSGGSGENDVRERGDDWPKLERLATLQDLTFTAVSNVFRPHLLDVVSSVLPPSNDLFFDPAAGNFVFTKRS